MSRLAGAALGTARSAIAQRRSLTKVAHRPWPVPPGRWIVGQSWHDLLFAHWRVPRDDLRAAVPAALELDSFDGEYWVGVVPFRMRAVRLAWCPPVRGTSSFAEVNLRTYVTSQGRPGVFFFSLDAGNRVAIEIGRRGWGLPYRRADVRMGRHGQAVEFRSSREQPGGPAARFAATYEPTGPGRAPVPGSLDAWLTERYCFYSVAGGHGPRRTEVHHLPWSLQPASADISVDGLAEPHGIRLDGDPLLHFARTQDVVAWAPRPG